MRHVLRLASLQRLDVDDRCLVDAGDDHRLELPRQQRRFVRVRLGVAVRAHPQPPAVRRGLLVAAAGPFLIVSAMRDMTREIGQAQSTAEMKMRMAVDDKKPKA